MICYKCRKEGHADWNRNVKKPWEYIAPFCGFASAGQGFYYIEDVPCEQGYKDMASCAVIQIKEGEVSARQPETEFRTLAGVESTWRWYAKKIAENQFQMRFPTAKKVELSHFIEMRMRTVPSAVIKINKWDASLGAKGKLDEAWFRIKGIPVDKRSESNVYHVGSLVGLSLELDKRNLTKFDYVRVKIGCRDASKVPAVVEGMLFQREVLQEGSTNPAGNKWIRAGGDDNNNGDNQSPKNRKQMTNLALVLLHLKYRILSLPREPAMSNLPQQKSWLMHKRHTRLCAQLQPHNLRRQAKERKLSI
uniref:Uncharacterized protein n=1 Tax=Arundo donax TaxID=35708 RepID=A0A0A8YVY0_ARUDO